MPVRSLSKLAFAAVLAGSTLVQAKPIARQEANTCTTINQRKSWTALTDSEKSAYIDAELCLQALPAQLADTSNAVTGAQNRWDEIHYTHIVQTNVIHNVGAFLPWHRLFVRAHEVLLQQECGYTGAQPYWDERSDIEQINNGTLTIDQLVVFDNQTGGPNVPSDDILALGNLSYPTAAVLDYDGDSGNVTTLNHTLWMVNLIANATAGDVMDLGGSTSCAEYV
ncbi:putative amino acid transporter [Diaporthe ampelina]|uniref:Putative amino acid transporter n=1 Tax=Diaporthe ampelina TaxID=1214573 RepID=A0A0G2HNV4_9PEZI|nr:putative amino acid transporter [Diaporthe ampelina]